VSFELEVEPLKVWQCVGCGRIDHPQPCIGVCRDQKAEIVWASDYARVVGRVRELEAALRRIVHTTPRAGDWERSYRALQQHARTALGD
jgi:hypothetical protein